ncbi:MAG: hypothetical protein ACTSYA_06725 [Candidatus Kariarchaeaceae archaeon]
MLQTIDLHLETIEVFDFSNQLPIMMDFYIKDAGKKKKRWIHNHLGKRVGQRTSIITAPDLLHLELAINLGCTHFATFDYGFVDTVLASKYPIQFDILSEK